jgi:thioesterase domain-containing protein
MTKESRCFIYFPGGGGGGEQDMATFAARLEDPIHFEAIAYPGWQRYVQPDFSAEAFVKEITAEIARRVPTGPIHLLGLSIGGHFAYAAALQLQQMGREIAFFCAIDSFMIASSQPSPGWQRRAIADALHLLKQGRAKEFARLLRSKAWRAILRMTGGRLAGILQRFSGRGNLPAIFNSDSVAEHELSMRLLIRAAAPWIAALDRNPLALTAPAILLRTQASAVHDAAWKVRCPSIVIREVPGKHLTLFEPENIHHLRNAFMAASSQLPA